MAKVFIYARVNNLDCSFTAAIALCQAKAISEGLDVDRGDVLTDVCSGLSRPEDRPGFADMVCRLGPDDVVIVAATSQIGRHVSDFFRAKDRIEKAGAKLIVVRS